MKSFTPDKLTAAVPVGLSWLMGTVMEHKGRQELFEHQKPEILETLRQVAIIRSTESSNRIEGVTVDPDRLEPLVLGKVRPKDRSEEEIVGYRKALAWIHDHYHDIRLEPETLQHLHRLSQAASGDAGEWKRVDNAIIQIHPDGRRTVRFQTVSVDDTPDMVEQLCLAYHHTCEQGTLPPLLCVANAVFDFTCIHPFRDGNGRVSRLLTLLLLYQHDYRVGRWVSLERLIEENKEGYYDALGRTSVAWYDSQHDLIPWWSHFLSIIRQAYQAFEERVKLMGNRSSAKADLVELAIGKLPSSFTLAELKAQCPAVSEPHIRRVLRRLRDANVLEAVGTGRGAFWKKRGS